MKYEIEIDDSLVPKGKVPKRLVEHKFYTLGPGGSSVENIVPRLQFEKAHVPKVPDFVPVGWYLSINIYGVAIMHENKPYFDSGVWRCNAATWDVTERLNNAEFDAIRGGLPSEQCCFQQKRNV